jgi:polysaccharide biosynthesis protein PslG
MRIQRVTGAEHRVAAIDWRHGMRRIAFLAAALLFAGVAHADAARKVPRGWLGVTVDGPVDARDAKEWDGMARAGVETVRAAFFWSRIQPNPPGASGAAFDFGATDALALAAASRGLALLPVVQWPPSWAAVQPGVFGSPPADPDAVRRMFAALVERYGPSGSLWRERPDVPRRPIGTWQVFNEPNLRGHWSVQPFEREYVATLRAAENGIHGVDPGATVVLGGLTNDSWRALRTIYAAGARGSFDAVAIHPYSTSPEKLVRIVRYARHVMRINGDGALPIWVTEFSWPAAHKPPAWARDLFGRPLTDRQQARRLNRTIRRFLSARERLGIARLLWYTWLSDEATETVTPFNYAGLRRVRDGHRRSTPALSVFRRWARRIEGCAKTANAHRCR